MPHPRLKASERVCEMLLELGVSPSLIWSNKGYWTHSTQDCYRWEFNGTFHGVTFCGGSYCSMKDCARPRKKLAWVTDWRDGEVCAVKEA
jgi:hypothetical protein